MPPLKRSRFIMILAIGLLASTVSTALAGNGATGTWEFQLNVGGTELDSDLGDAGFRMGTRAGFNFTEYFELNAEISGTSSLEILRETATLD